MKTSQPITGKENTIKYYYLFIGAGIENIDDKKNRYIVESKKLVRKGFLFSGSVVARNKKAHPPLNYHCNGWVNPVDETLEGFYPSFVRVNQKWVETAKFFEKELD